MLIILVFLIGIIAGGIVNALADDLPERRRPQLPRYPDGTPRPLIAWLGITAFPVSYTHLTLPTTERV